MAVVEGYLEGPGPLFASYHAPVGPARNLAWVVCTPIHLDLIQSYRSMRRLAEELASAGFHVLRIHYEGTGESIGSTDLDPGRVEAWLASVRRAVEAMRGIEGVEGVAIAGVRIGATFALETATHLDIAKLVLWEPSAGAFYAREMEILASSSPQPKKLPTEDGGVVAGGFWLSKATLADLGKLDPEKMAIRGTPDVMLVYRDDRRPSPRLGAYLEKHGCAVTSVQLPGHKEMMVMPQKSAVPNALLAAIREWTVERSRVAEGGNGAAAGPELTPTAKAGGLRWTALRFGSAKHLFGVLTEPEGGSKMEVPPVLLLTGGVTPRTAGNNSYITLAKRLAKKGHSVLRMDVSFIGESSTPTGAPGHDTDPFPPSILDDARAGLERIGAEVSPTTKVWIYGLCSGAYAAFHTARAAPRTKGAFFVNPERFELGGAGNADDASATAAAPPMAAVDQIEQMNRYWQVMRDPKAWKKLLSGKADVRYLANVLRSRAGSLIASASERIGSKLGRAPKGLAGGFHGLVTSGVRVHLVFSEGDPGHAAVVAELGARYDELLEKGLGVKIFAGADHNFHEMDSRADMIDWVESVIHG